MNNEPLRLILASGLVVLFAGLGVGCSGLSQIDLVDLVTSGRDGWQHPDRVIASLDIQPGDTVAEIGAGTGYWVDRLAEAVGPTGSVHLVEVEPERVADLQEHVDEAGLEHVTVVLGDYDDPNLPDGQIDLVMTCLTYHHIEARPEYFRRLTADLSERGRVAHLDDHSEAGAPIRWFQTEGHWSDPDMIVSEMSDAGYRPVARFDFLPAQSFQIFVPVSANAHTAQAPRLGGAPRAGNELQRVEEPPSREE